MTIFYSLSAVSEMLVLCDLTQVNVTDGGRPVDTENPVQTSIYKSL